MLWDARAGKGEGCLLRSGASERDQIHELWDSLAEIPMSPPEKPIKILFQRLTSLLGSQRGMLIMAVKLADAPINDPLAGWRPRTYTSVERIGNNPKYVTVESNTIKQVDYDESTRNHALNAGRFRATLLSDHVSPQYFDSEFYYKHYLRRGINDRMFVVLPINDYIESYFIFDRIEDNVRFTCHELNLAVYALRSLSWLVRTVSRCFGHIRANEILTPKEREILGYLLAGNSDKRIARLVDQAPNTTHQHIATLFRKFGVTSRTQLMSLWMNH